MKVEKGQYKISEYDCIKHFLIFLFIFYISPVKISLIISPLLIFTYKIYFFFIMSYTDFPQKHILRNHISYDLLKKIITILFAKYLIFSDYPMYDVQKSKLTINNIVNSYEFMKSLTFI